MPDAIWKAIFFLADLPQDQMNSLISEFEKPTQYISHNAIARAMSKKIGLPREDLNLVLTFVLTFSGIQQEKSLDVNGILEPMIKSLSEEKKLTPEQLGRLRERIPKLLEIKTVEVINEGLKAHSNQALILRRAEIRSKILPMTSDVNSGLVLHELKIMYKESNIDKDIYFTLGSYDIRKLIDLLTGAERKNELTRKNLKDKGFELIDYR